jgi:hypothetical protein
MVQGTGRRSCLATNTTPAWDDFYRKGHVDTPTPFAIAVTHCLAALEAVPVTIVDLGCGNGRDSLYLASFGSAV